MSLKTITYCTVGERNKHWHRQVTGIYVWIRIKSLHMERIQRRDNNRLFLKHTIWLTLSR